LREQQIPSLRLHEFFLADVEALVAEFLEMMDERLALNEIPALCASVSLKLIQDPQYRRFKTTVDMDTALDLYNTPRFYYSHPLSPGTLFSYLPFFFKE
jgi:glycogen debranching enzyme